MWFPMTPYEIRTVGKGFGSKQASEEHSLLPRFLLDLFPLEPAQNFVSLDE